jgi:hypothetical protein
MKKRFGRVALPASRFAVCKAATGLLLAFTCFLSGCAGFAYVVPVPHKGDKAITGHIFEREDLKKILPGKTTRAEVVSRMGIGFRQTHDNWALSYSWEKSGPDMYHGLFFAAASYGGSGVFGEFGKTDSAWSYWRAIFIQFDADDLVVEAEFIRLSSRKSLDEQLEAWNSKNRAKTTGKTSTPRASPPPKRENPTGERTP